MCLKYKTTHLDVFALPKRRSSLGKYLIILFGEKVLFELAEKKLMLLELLTWKKPQRLRGVPLATLVFSPPLVCARQEDPADDKVVAMHGQQVASVISFLGLRGFKEPNKEREFPLVVTRAGDGSAGCDQAAIFSFVYCQ